MQGYKQNQYTQENKLHVSQYSKKGGSKSKQTKKKIKNTLNPHNSKHILF